MDSEAATAAVGGRLRAICLRMASFSLPRSVDASISRAVAAGACRPLRSARRWPACCGRTLQVGALLHRSACTPVTLNREDITLFWATKLRKFLLAPLHLVSASLNLKKNLNYLSTPLIPSPPSSSLPSLAPMHLSFFSPFSSTIPHPSPFGSRLLHFPSRQPPSPPPPSWHHLPPLPSSPRQPFPSLSFPFRQPFPPLLPPFLAPSPIPSPSIPVSFLRCRKEGTEAKEWKRDRSRRKGDGWRAVLVMEWKETVAEEGMKDGARKRRGEERRRCQKRKREGRGNGVPKVV